MAEGTAVLVEQSRVQSSPDRGLGLLHGPDSLTPDASAGPSFFSTVRAQAGTFDPEYRFGAEFRLPYRAALSETVVGFCHAKRKDREKHSARIRVAFELQ